jgi:ADP-heptose:LPS heptosyltransferase
LEMQGLLKSALATVRAKTKKRVGYHWQREGSALFSSRVLPDPSSHHIVDQYLDVARAAGGTEVADFALKPRDEDLARARELIGDATVLINPGAGWVNKRWPAAHVATLMDMLHYRGIVSALIGGKGEADIHAEILRLTEGRGFSLAGQTSVRELVALISLGSAHVGGDTGSTHVAAALGVPAVGLYSITNPRRSCPYGQIERSHYDPRGLDGIEPDAVFATVVEALG